MNSKNNEVGSEVQLNMLLTLHLKLPRKQQNVGQSNNKLTLQTPTKLKL